MVAGVGAWSQEFAAAAPQLQRINDDWEAQLRLMFDKLAEADAEGGAEDVSDGREHEQ